MNEAEILRRIDLELSRARDKFPDWPTDLIHAAAIVAEESGELVQSTLQQHYEGGDLFTCDKEAIHTAAMAIRFLMRG